MSDNTPPSIKEIPATTFIAERHELVHGIFGPDLADGPMFKAFTRNLFPHEGWNVILLPHWFSDLNLTELHENETWRRMHNDWYRPVNWIEVLLSVHWTRPMPHLYQAIAGFFTAEFERFRADDFLTEQDAVVFEVPAIGAMIEGLSLPSLGIFWNQMLIDPLGEWGMIDDNDFMVSMLGAKGPLFDRFVMALGGMKAIQNRFAYCLLCKAVKGSPPPPDTMRDDLIEAPLAAWRPIYERIGWPWPFPDHIGKSGAAL